jgi:hypothetical protein
MKPVEPSNFQKVNKPKKSLSRRPSAKVRPTVAITYNLSEMNNFDGGNSLPPLPVLVAFADKPIHRYNAHSSEYDLHLMLKELGDRLIRSNWERARSKNAIPRTILFESRLLGSFIYCCDESITVFAPTVRLAERIALKMDRYLLPPKIKGGCFQLLSSMGRGFTTKSVALNPSTHLTDPELDLHYGQGFAAWSDSFASGIDASESGLTIFEGVPGTGKTSYLRHLMNVLERTHRFYYVPPSSVEYITSSSLVDFWNCEQIFHDERKFVLILEDAEEALMSRAQDNRSLVSALLNISDGLLGNFLKLQVICTINCKSNDIDRALLRPGRLLEHRIFSRLSYDHAQRLALEKGITLSQQEDYSLAEIFRGKGTSYSQEKGTAGFGK